MTEMNRHSGKIIGGHKGDDAGGDIIGSHALMGHAVITALGERVGEIHDVLIDMESGRVAYAVLDFDCVVGGMDKLYAVPWIAMTLDADNHCFILHVDKRRLREAPSIQREPWPACAGAHWAEQVHSFYSAEPFWRYHA